MGLGWNVTFENQTKQEIEVVKIDYKNWYPNDLDGRFKLGAGQKTTKYTEIKSSVFSPLEISYLIFLVQLHEGGKEVEIELKGTNGDLNNGFKQIIDGDGFEIGMRGQTDLINFQASKDGQVNLNLAFT